MKTILTLIVATGVLVGCTCTPVIKTEIVTVNKPIPFIPPPPTVPTIQYKVDELSVTDNALPGKVGQAYVYDMTFLRKRIEIDDLIFEQYRNGSAEFKDIEQKIHDLYSGVETRIPPDPATFTPVVPK
jgi:hypothetical protein